MRALVPVAVVAILAVTFLIVWITHRRREVRRAEFSDLRDENRRLHQLVSDITTETQLQLDAGYASHGYTADLIHNFSRQEREL